MKLAKAILQKAVTEKPRYILMTVIDADTLGLDFENAPQIVEVPLRILSPNIYTGEYPNIQIMLDQIKNREDLKGMGIAGIITKEKWACVEVGKSLFEEYKI